MLGHTREASEMSLYSAHSIGKNRVVDPASEAVPVDFVLLRPVST